MKEPRDLVHRKNNSLLQQKYQTMNPDRTEQNHAIKLNKINEGYQNQKEKMDVMSNDILKLSKREKSKNKETLEPKNVKFDVE